MSRCSHCAGTEIGDVASLGKFDPDCVRPSLSLVILLESLPQPVSFHAHDGVDTWVKALFTVEYLQPEYVFLYSIKMARKPFLHDEAQETAGPARTCKGTAGYDLLEVEADRHF
jgi:hypothetical protein